MTKILHKKEMKRICDEVRNTQIDNTWTLRKEMALDNETVVKTYMKIENNWVRIRSVVDFNYSSLIVAGLVKFPIKIVQMYPCVLEIKQCDDTNVLKYKIDTHRHRKQIHGHKRGKEGKIN